MKDLYERIEHAVENGETVAVATIARTRGSTPRERGAKMIISTNGGMLGTVGGGCGEAEVWRTALNVIEDQRPRMVHVDLTEEIDLKSEGVCGGTLDIFVDPWGPGQKHLLHDADHGLVDAIERRQPVALCTVIERTRPSTVEPGTKVIVDGSGTLRGTLGDASLDARAAAGAIEAIQAGIGRVVTVSSVAADEVSGVLPGGEVEILIEVYLPPPTMLILGAGHIAQPLARMAKMLEFEVVVVDDRPSFASRERFPDADQVIAGDFEATLRDFSFGPQTHAVLVTRGHQYDVFSLRHMIHHDVAYIGMVGSQRRVWAVYKLLHDEGVSPDRIARIHAPIGIDLKAETPAEIAISILAEVVKLRRGGTAPSLSDRLRERYLNRLTSEQHQD
jgi:xanthine dehydrogenase accessory factor